MFYFSLRVCLLESNHNSTLANSVLKDLFFTNSISIARTRGFTPSGCIGKVVASHAEVARSIPGLAETAPSYTIVGLLLQPVN